MMPKKAEEEKRSIVIGVKVDTKTKEKVEYLAGMNGVKVSTYIYNLLVKHINEKEPWISKEIEDLKAGENQ